MSLQHGAHQSTPKLSAFLESLIRFLMPFFIATAADVDAARADILETLDAYATRTRAEALNAARIIAFSMATLDTLSEATSGTLSPAMKLRYRSCANGLNRATAQTEKALDQSLARDLPVQTDALAEPINDVSDAETQATIDHATAAIQAHRDRKSAFRPVATSNRNQPDRNKQLWAGAMRDTLKQMGIDGGPTPAG